MTDHASYVFSAYSMILSLPKEQLLNVGNSAAEGSPIPSFDEELLISLCEDALKIFEKEENIIEINGDAIVVGDIHGSFHDLLRILSYTEHCQSKVIFLGDYVDRGNFSLECVTLLFSLKILKPDTYFLLRGNHEFVEMGSNYGFKKEILNYHNPKKIKQVPTEKIQSKEANEAIIMKVEPKRKNRSDLLEDLYFNNHVNISCYKYTERLFNAFMNSFSYLPICAIINHKSICLHGGLSPLLDKVKNIQKQIQKPITDFSQSNLLTDIVWGDPAPDQRQTFLDNPRGRGKVFNGPVVVNFLKNHNFTRLIRGHECVHNGIGKLFNGKCITLFSASSYSCDMGNSSAILKIFQNTDKTETLIFSPLRRLKKCDASYYKVQAFGQTEENKTTTISICNKKISDYQNSFFSSRMRITEFNSDYSLGTIMSKSDENAETSRPIMSSKRQPIFNRRIPSLKSGPRKRVANGALIVTPQTYSQKYQSCD